VTPRELRGVAAVECGWQPGTKPSPSVIHALVKLSNLHPSGIRRALSRRDKRIPKSPGGPATEPVYIRLNAEQKKKALKLAKKAGYETVSGWVKALVEREVGNG
jgi:hypothetical protein